MCDAAFTFGQRGSHFFQSATRREIARLPKKLSLLLNSKQLQKIHHVTLGFENSFLVTWRDIQGGDHIESQGLPQELTTFLYAKNAQNVLVRNIPEIRLTLGPYNASFFVHDAAAYLWMNLPPALLTAIQSRIQNGAWADKPRIVALGADDNFLLVTQRNAAVWDLEHYATLEAMIEFSRTQEHGIEEVGEVVLHAYRYQCFVALSRNGTLLAENLPLHEVQGLDAMREAIVEEAREAAERRVRDRIKERERLEKERRAEGDRERERERERQRQAKRPLLQHQGTFKKEWTGRKHEFQAKAKGMKLSLSLSVTASAFGRMLK
ncbi:hypothetical protein BS50DRAFT_572632 [Corynespora cassiicola Philippines]|uniref:Uncharacterized protein n=1 Tax=Corynespora cassiicola Philippines TaxID=1448308 RepID=A0A2T2NVP5_CORCC|nr:hypothetical protein BS50DRAFT_572632 [Corynespora cassiicola Philippines]